MVDGSVLGKSGRLRATSRKRPDSENIHEYRTKAENKMQDDRKMCKGGVWGLPGGMPAHAGGRGNTLRGVIPSRARSSFPVRAERDILPASISESSGSESSLHPASRSNSSGTQPSPRPSRLPDPAHPRPNPPHILLLIRGPNPRLFAHKALDKIWEAELAARRPTSRYAP